MHEKDRVSTALKTGPATSGFDQQMNDFLDAVRTGRTPVSNIDQAVSLMKMLMAVYESSSSVREVRFAG